MTDWIDVSDSGRVSAVAYDAEEERILVHFKDTELLWQYRGCPPFIWDEFMDPSTSKGLFIHERLNHHDHGPYTE